MADVFISYSRKDADFVRVLHAALAQLNRDTWVDWEDIPATAKWQWEIYAAIEAADAFVFVISPDSVVSEVCRQEIDHAVKQNKRLVPVVRHDVDAKAVPEPLAALNWIFFRESDEFGSAFQTLLKALDTDLEWVRAHTRLLVRAIEWADKGHDNSFVLRGNDLQAAEHWLVQGAEKEPKPTALQTQYIIVSRKAATTRQRVTLGAVTSGLIVALMLAMAAFYQYRIAESRRQLALSRQLAVQALTHMDDHFDLAVLLSLQANYIHETIEARGSVLDVLEYSPYLTTFLRGHTAPVNSVAFSPDGKTLASGSDDNTIKLWDVAAGKSTAHPLEGHTHYVRSVAFSPRGRMLVSAGWDPIDPLILWNDTAHHFTRPRFNRRDVNSVAFNPDGTILALGLLDGSIVLWDVFGEKQLGQLSAAHKSSVWNVAFSPDGTTLASGSCGVKETTGSCRQGVIHLWDVVKREPLREPLVGHKDWVKSVAFSPDGKVLASGSDDRTIRLWDVATFKNLGEPLTGHTGAVNSVAFSPDGKILASASSDRTIRLWDVATHQLRGKPLTGHVSGISSVAFGPDGRTLASGSDDTTVILWDLAARQALTGHTGAVNSVAFSPHGILLASGSEDHSIGLWDIATHQPIGKPLTAHSDAVNSVVFSHDGTIMASGSRDKTIVRWDVATRQRIGEPLTGHMGEVLSLAFSPNGDTLVSGSADKRLILWNVAARQPSGQRLSAMITSDWVRSVAFSPDGTLLASGHSGPGGFNDIFLWNVDTHRQLDLRLVGQTVAFSPDGRMFASGVWDGSIRLWNVADGKPLEPPLAAHTSGVRSIAFSPDGKMLASGSEDHTIILWDVAARRPLGQPLTGHQAKVLSVAFSPDGKMLASGGEDRTTILWDVSFDSWQRRACRIANRNLTQAEWNQFVGPDIPYERTCENLPSGG